MEHAPVVLDEVVGIAPVLMQQVLVAAVEVLPGVVVGKLLLGIDLEALPLCARLPPGAAAAGIAAEAIAPAVGLSQVARHQILERVAYLVGNGMSASGLQCPGVAPQRPYHVIIAGAGGEPFRLVEHEDLYLVFVGRLRLSGNDEAQRVGIEVEEVLGTL